jgi:hypothetical protein
MSRLSFPFRKQLPWVLLVVSVVVLATGMFSGSAGLLIIGAVGFIGFVAGYALPRLLLKDEDEGEAGGGS